MFWQYRHQAEALCKLLNAGRLSTEYMDGNPKRQATSFKHNKLVTLSHTDVDLVKEYPPSVYFYMCHMGELPQEHNNICNHEISLVTPEV